jgi:hypothetical protein
MVVGSLVAAELPFLHLDPSERRIHDKSLWGSLYWLNNWVITSVYRSWWRLNKADTHSKAELK